MLEVTDLHVYYGQIHALKGISFRVGQGEIVTLLGNNGAGKTTTLRTLSGLLAPRQGDVRFEGASLLGIAAHDVVLKGITHVPEGRRIFNRLSVVENLEMGAYTRSDSAIAEDMDHVFTTFPRLKERRAQVAGTLSGGEQQVLAINRQGVTVLLVEQNAAMALSIAERGYVLETGRLPLEGAARELADNPEVRRAYLGEA